MPCVDHKFRDGYDDCPYCEIVRLKAALEAADALADYLDLVSRGTHLTTAYRAARRGGGDSNDKAYEPSPTPKVVKVPPGATRRGGG